MKTLEIIQYTDPMCIWCYAMEPAIRKLQTVLGDQLVYRNVCGLLVGDVRQIIGNDEYSDIRFAQLKNQMKGHFTDAASCSGVPVDPSWLNEAKKEDVTSLPMTLAFEAIKLQNPKRADEFLWECRANSHARKTIMSRRENVIALAEKFVADKDQFLKDFDGAAARNALEKDLEACHSKNIHSFPTMELVWEGKSYIVNGYRSYPDLVSIIQKVTDGQLHFEEPVYSMEAVLDFIHQFKTVTGADLKLMYSLSSEELEALVQKLVSAGAVSVETSAQGEFIHEAAGLHCENGTCSLF